MNVLMHRILVNSRRLRERLQEMNADIHFVAIDKEVDYSFETTTYRCVFKVTPRNGDEPYMASRVVAIVQ